MDITNDTLLQITPATTTLAAESDNSSTSRTKGRYSAFLQPNTAYLQPKGRTELGVVGTTTRFERRTYAATRATKDRSDAEGGTAIE